MVIILPLYLCRRTANATNRGIESLSAFSPIAQTQRTNLLQRYEKPIYSASRTADFFEHYKSSIYFSFCKLFFTFFYSLNTPLLSVLSGMLYANDFARLYANCILYPSFNRLKFRFICLYINALYTTCKIYSLPLFAQYKRSLPSLYLYFILVP